jgi:hypothetical protein
MTKTRTPNYGIGTGGGMEERRVAVKTRWKRGVRRREGYINGDYRCGALIWVPGLSGEHADTGGLDEAT